MKKIIWYQIVFSLICWPGEILCLLWLIIELIYNKVDLLQIEDYVNNVWMKKLSNKIIQNIAGAINVLTYIYIFHN